MQKNESACFQQYGNEFELPTGHRDRTPHHLPSGLIKHGKFQATGLMQICMKQKLAQPMRAWAMSCKMAVLMIKSTFYIFISPFSIKR